MVAGHRAKDKEELEKHADQAILSMASGKTKGPSWVPPYYGTEGGHSAQIWITGLEKLKGVQKWSDNQTPDAADLALFGIAAEWKAAQMEANTEVFQDLKLFKAAFVNRLAIQQSSVESIKLVMELKQKSDKKDFYDRVFNVIMYFGRERKLEMAAANQQEAFKHYYLCLTDFVKLLFIGGTKPKIHTVLESKYNSLKDEESLLDAALEAEVATSAPTALADRRISQLEAEIAALRFSSSRGGSTSGRGASSSHGGQGSVQLRFLSWTLKTVDGLNSPIFLVPKPHGHGMRAVPDFLEVNNASVPDLYTIREIRDSVDEIGLVGSKIFLTIDLTRGFWEQSLEESSRQYTAFTVPGKVTHYQCTVTPMGLQASPASFARLIDYVMRGLSGVLTYIDDVLVHTPDH